MFMRICDEVIIGNDYQPDYLGFPPDSDDSFWNPAIHMVGSCNGLICIHERLICIHEPRYKVVSLWNPATRQIRILPEPLPQPLTIEKQGILSLSKTFLDRRFIDFTVFGFDVKTKDYKVVRFRCFRTACQPVKWFCQVQVYSLSTDSWRLLEGIHDLPARPYELPYQNNGIYMNGCYFFVGKQENKNNNVIYSFDFTKEILTTIQSPDHDSRCRHDLILTYLGGDKIALFIIQRNNSFGGVVPEFHDCGLDYEYYHLWVLNEQPGNSSNCVNNESWTKLHSFRKLNKLQHLSQPRCISNNGEFALISTSLPLGSTELQLFNLVTGEATKDFPFGQGIIRADVYRQSLVSIIGGNGAAADDRVVVGGAM